MKKLGKLSLKQLKEEIQITDEKMLKSITGGYDPNDCMWRCFAYLNGTSYGANDAEDLACNYYGSDSFDSTNYGFTGTYYDADGLGCDVLGTIWDDPFRDKILVFNPCDFTGWNGNENSMHAVIITGVDAEKYYVFDPQSGMSGEILASEYSASASPKYVL